MKIVSLLPTITTTHGELRELLQGDIYPSNSTLALTLNNIRTATLPKSIDGTIYLVPHNIFIAYRLIRDDLATLNYNKAIKDPITGYCISFSSLIYSKDI